jgi:ABC-2 type transport system permease protein
MVPAIPSFGDEAQRWLPFVLGTNFLQEGLPADPGGMPAVFDNLPFGAWGCLAYFAAWAVALLALALALVKRRDA